MILAAVSDIAREVDRAFLIIGGISLVLLVGVTLAMILFALRFHRSKSPRTEQIEGHKWLEITWIVIPTLLVTWMFFIGYEGFAMMRNVPADAMVVQVTGKQWVWTFYYPEEKLHASEMVVPINQAVKVELTAPPDDVIHSFYIPDFRVKEDVLPGKNTYLWFRADRAGTYNIFCAEFCGKDHSKMIAMLKVVAPDEYRHWLRAQVMKRYVPLVYEGVVDPNHKTFGPDELSLDTEGMYKTYCASCHGDKGDGSGLPGLARDFTKPDGWRYGPKVADIYRTLATGVPGTQMRPYPNLTPWERVALAHKVRSYLIPPPPPDSPEDFAALVQEYELDKIQAPGETIPIEKAIDLLAEEKKP